VKPLLDAGWSPAAAVAVRAGAAGVVLVPFVLASLRRDLGVLRRSWRRIAAFGLVGVAACQLCYFAAVERLPVGIALLIEYLGPVLLVGFTWATTRVRPATATLVGAAVATAGLFLVLDLTGATDIDLVGVAWALGAAVGLACFFVLSAQQDDDLPPVALAATGLFVGAVAVAVVGLVGAVPLTVAGGDVELLDGTAPWYVPMATIVLVSTSFAYATGVFAAGRLGSRVASFVGLVEVLFAVLLSWALLDEVPTAVQALGGALIVVGVVLVRSGHQEEEPLGVEPLVAEATR
jgi:drug/metabolite transporter (DMT)-like permease